MAESPTPGRKVTLDDATRDALLIHDAAKHLAAAPQLVPIDAHGMGHFTIPPEYNHGQPKDIGFSPELLAECLDLPYAPRHCLVLVVAENLRAPTRAEAKQDTDATVQALARRTGTWLAAEHLPAPVQGAASVMVLFADATDDAAALQKVADSLQAEATKPSGKPDRSR